MRTLVVTLISCWIAFVGTSAVASETNHKKEPLMYALVESVKTNANIREEPNTKSAVVGKIYHGDIVHMALGEETDLFYKVSFHNRQFVGWVSKELIEPIADLPINVTPNFLHVLADDLAQN